MITRFFLIVALNVLSVAAVNAQDWKSIFKGVAETVGEKVTDKVGGKVDLFTIQGQWRYVKPECKFTSQEGNILSKAGSEIVSNKIEDQITRVMDKLHIDSTSVFTFNADSTYVITLGKTVVRGTYSINKESKEITLTSRLKKSHTASYERNLLEAGSVTLLFNADKLMNFVQSIAGGLSKSSTTTLKAVTSILNKYDGLMLGYKLRAIKEQEKNSVQL